jgi:adenylate cyclase class 2
LEQLEIELKFYMADLEPIRTAICNLGAVSHGRVFETNIRFEDSNNSLIRKKSLLRLRKDSTAKLTFKSEPSVKDTQFKIHRELEVQVSDFDLMYQILEALGYHKEQLYEKWRETLILNHTHFCLDTMPYGNFLEIEGERAEIQRLAALLGLKWERRILMNYLKIFEIIRQESQLSFSDITFENFKNIRIETSGYLHRIEMNAP